MDFANWKCGVHCSRVTLCAVRWTAPRFDPRHCCISVPSIHPPSAGGGRRSPTIPESVCEHAAGSVMGTAGRGGCGSGVHESVCVYRVRVGIGHVVPGGLSFQNYLSRLQRVFPTQHETERRDGARVRTGQQGVHPTRTSIDYGRAYRPMVATSLPPFSPRAHTHTSQCV